VSVDLAGNERPLVGALRGFQYPRYSPDGERLAVTICEPGETNIWVLDLATGAQTKLTLEGTHQFPLWSPDGDRVTYLSIGTTRALSIDWRRADGSGASEVLIQGQPGEWLDPGSWTPDGGSLIYTRSSFQRERRTTIWIAARDGEREPRPFLPEIGTFASALSPDGRWLAYGSYRSGRPEIYVQPFPDGGERHQVSSDGGWNAVWSPDGRTIYYLSEDEERIRSGPGDRIMAVPVATTPRFRVGAARVLLEGSHEGGTWSIFRSFDVAPDGKSLVMVKPDEEHGNATEIRVVLNWFEELERLAPTDGSR
jgi:Tol biopolymer transport system component